ncbi:hypothetical protein [Corynebacterium pacaense]|uniref:hypothetical protein n=1 Tax=Corynebacterium pacaense TaxID=1816684 RepID=UPI0009B94C57|nr:hypothetical protein [Corynebacterium pacaense]
MAIVLILTVALVLLLAIDAHRDFNTGVFRFHPRSRVRPRMVSGIIGITLLSTRGSAITWCAVCGLIILTMLPVTNSLIPALTEDNATLQVIDELLPEGDVQSELIIYIFQLVSILVAIAGILPMVAYAREERTHLIDSVRATGVPRGAPLRAAVVASIVTVLTCAAAAALAGLAGLGLQNSNGGDGVTVVLLASLSIIAQTAPLVGSAVFFAGLGNRAIHLTWGPVVLASTVSLLGPVLGLSRAQIDLSPLSHTLRSTGDGTMELAVSLAVGSALVLVGIFLGSRRDLV